MFFEKITHTTKTHSVKAIENLTIKPDNSTYDHA